MASGIARLDGKVAIVTGGAQGIGRAIAIRLAAEGAKVVLCARDQGTLDEVVRQVHQAGGEASSSALDLSLETSPAQLLNAAVARHGAIDVVVNNAGATKRGDFLTLSEEDWTDGFALKFYAAVRLTRAAWPYLKATWRL